MNKKTSPPPTTTFLMSVLLDPTAEVEREGGGVTADQLSAVIQTVR